MNTTILVIEDDPIWQKVYYLSFKQSANILQATNLVDAEAIFLENPGINLIVIDGYLGETILNTLPLIKKLRETFKGEIIAVSTDEDSRTRMVAAGCSSQVDKNDSVPFIERYLHLQLQNS